MTTATKRQLYLIRHAKAAEEDSAGDHTRPLQPRGHAAAVELGAWLGERGDWPEQVICSTATCTRQTLDGLGKTIPTILSEKLYLASAGDLLATIQQSDDDIKTLMLLGHNPGLHGLLALLTGEYANDEDADRLILKFPTAACAILSIDAPSWRDIAPQSARLEALRY